MEFPEPQKTLVKKIERTVKKYRADNRVAVHRIVFKAGMAAQV